MMCSSWVSFWYVSVALFFLPVDLGVDLGVDSMIMLSFSTSASGTPPDFLGGGAFFCFLELGGVCENPEVSSSETLALAVFRFFVAAGLLLIVDCVSFFAADFAAGFAF